MSLEFVESFDADTSLSTTKWDVISAFGGLSIDSSAGRNGSNGLLINIGNNACYLQKNLPDFLGRIIGFALNVRSIASESGIVAFIDGSTMQVEVTLDASGHFNVYRGGSTLLATSTAALTFGVWHYIEIVAAIDTASGAVEIDVDGTSFITLTSANTQATGTQNIGAVCIGQTNFANAHQKSMILWIDDIYEATADATGISSFLTDQRVQALLPTSDSSVQWTKSTGASNFSCVDEVPPNEDTDYVSSATPGQKDLYGFPAASPSTANINAVIVTARARKDDAGTRTIAPTITSNGTASDGPTQPVGTTYSRFWSMYELDPHTAAQWTLSNANSATAGVTEIA